MLTAKQTRVSVLFCTKLQIPITSVSEKIVAEKLQLEQWNVNLRKPLQQIGRLCRIVLNSPS